LPKPRLPAAAEQPARRSIPSPASRAITRPEFCTNTKARVIKEWEKAIADPDIDVVVIATPDFWHAPTAIAAAKAKKDIYVEKGWCMTLDEAKQMRKAVEDNKVIVQSHDREEWSSGNTRPYLRNRVLSLTANASRGLWGEHTGLRGGKVGHKEVLVTHLRKLTLDEIACRNYTEGTTRIYLATIEDSFL